MEKISLYNISRDTFQPNLVDIDYIYSLQLDAQHNPYEYGFELKDNTGDNISYLYQHYGNLTGLYWIWKNGVPVEATDIGVMIHDRQIYFGENKEVTLTPSNEVIYQNTHEYFAKKDIIFPQETLNTYLESNELLLPSPEDTSNENTMQEFLNKTNYERFLESGVIHADHFNAFKKAIAKLYPTLTKYVKMYLASTALSLIHI